MESVCVICGDDRDIRKHYGVVCCFGCKGFFRRTVNDGRQYKCPKTGSCAIDKISRNRCRACRFQKCVSAGMNENYLRETKNRNCDPPTIVSSLPTTSNHSEVEASSLNLINFLNCLTKASLQMFDPDLADLPPEKWVEMEKKCNRSISLIEGIKNPEKVCPRTKLDWSCRRKAEDYDLSFSWYRWFVAVADWANNIPQFRMLPDQDQELLMMYNFSTVTVVVFADGYFETEDFLKIQYPLGNGSFISEEEMKACAAIMSSYAQHILQPMKVIDMDNSEFTLLSTIMLFQFHEGLSPQGRKIAKEFEDRLFDALFDYQVIRFPNLTARERTQRQTRMLMTIAKIPQLWAIESDFHLVLSTFQRINIDGIPRQLLFSKFGQNI